MFPRMVWCSPSNRIILRTQRKHVNMIRLDLLRRALLRTKEDSEALPAANFKEDVNFCLANIKDRYQKHHITRF